MNLVFLWGLKGVQPNTKYLKEIVKKYETNFPEPFTPVYVFGNHDSKRLMTKLDDDERAAALLTLFQFTARGVPVTYYGEEIGMSEVVSPTVTAKDPIGRRYKYIPDFLLRWLDIYTNRDGCRSPMQWENTANGGFCEPGIEPWLPINNNFSKINVANENNTEGSLLRIYREVLKIRKDSNPLHSGRLELVDTEHILAYKRIYDQEALHILINFSSIERVYQEDGNFGEITYQIGESRKSENDEIILGSYSGLIVSEIHQDLDKS